MAGTIPKLCFEYSFLLDQYACSRGGFLMASYEYNCREWSS